MRYYWLLCVFLSGYLLDGQGVSLPRVFVRGKEGGTKASLPSTATSHQHSQLSIPSVGLALLLEVPASMCDQDATAGTQDASLYQSTPATIAHAGTSPGRAPRIKKSLARTSLGGPLPAPPLQDPPTNRKHWPSSLLKVHATSDAVQALSRPGILGRAGNMRLGSDRVFCHLLSYLRTILAVLTPSIYVDIRSPPGIRAEGPCQCMSKVNSVLGLHIPKALGKDYPTIVLGKDKGGHVVREKVCKLLLLESQCKERKNWYNVLACHKCDHAWCVNINHLYWGNHVSNRQDRDYK